MTLSVVCIQTGNYQGRGLEYVSRLRSQVRAHLKLKHRFFCITDDAAADYPVTCKPAVHSGWWEKIRLFKPGMFPEGRVLFLDLDTIIVGNIDDIVGGYKGPFATLHDFWRPQGLGPAVMLWESGWGDFIYQEWAAEGFPQTDPRGDQAWLENLNQGRMRKEVDILQQLFPGRFVSYKTSCTQAVPAGASVVCFHGNPRPHEAGGWVKSYWS